MLEDDDISEQRGVTEQQEQKLTHADVKEDIKLAERMKFILAKDPVNHLYKVSNNLLLQSLEPYQIEKPSWRPPNWAFGPAWTYLYSTMGYASYRVWLELYKPNLLALADLPLPLKLFLLQILLNWLWTPIFFGLKKVAMAVIEICLLDVAVIMTMFAFLEVDSLAGLLFLPYLAWLTFATLLTVSIWKTNPQWCYGPLSSKEK
ncbi:translocator protein-like [Homarus americanus]|uniref:translocator protein-like n=1 Tax=Homarus americanus TaxID=6706 RepID=UPI001C460318|nr:translocator protein-like [Homarus americanus]